MAPASMVGNLVARSDSRTTVWGGSCQSALNGFPFGGLTLSQSAAPRCPCASTRIGWR